jgi:hypothetical protein
MTNDSLEQRVQALEKAVAELRNSGGKPADKWWEKIGWDDLTPEQRQTAEDANAYGRYYRATGQMPPPDWKPGDPIPEVDW